MTRFTVNLLLVLMVATSLVSAQQGNAKPKPNTTDNGLAGRVAALEDSVARLQDLVGSGSGGGVPGLAVLDDNNQVVGTLLSYGTLLWERGGIWLISPINKTGFTANRPSQILYTQPDCPPEDAYLEVPDPHALVRAAWFEDDAVLYAEPVIQAVAQSYRWGSTGQCVNMTTPMTRSMGRKNTIPISELGWTPPFRLR